MFEEESSLLFNPAYLLTEDECRDMLNSTNFISTTPIPEENICPQISEAEFSNVVMEEWIVPKEIDSFINGFPAIEDLPQVIPEQNFVTLEESKSQKRKPVKKAVINAKKSKCEKVEKKKVEIPPLNQETIELFNSIDWSYIPENTKGAQGSRLLNFEVTNPGPASYYLGKTELSKSKYPEGLIISGEKKCCCGSTLYINLQTISEESGKLTLSCETNECGKIEVSDRITALCKLCLYIGKNNVEENSLSKFTLLENRQKSEKVSASAKIFFGISRISAYLSEMYQNSLNKKN